MKKTAYLVVAVLAAGVAARAADEHKPPVPQKEHEWLKQLDGEWVTETEAVMEPGKPPMKMTGTEVTRNLGGLWSVGEFKGECMGVPVTGLLTIGYDAQAKKYNGTWVCSMCDHLCKYEGTLQGNVLTLNTEMPNPATGKLTKMKDVIEVKGKDHKVLKSSMLGDDGKWVEFMTINARRK